MNNHRIPFFKHSYFSISMFLFFATIVASGYNTYSADEKVFQLDYANFMGSDSGSTRLEIYCQFSNADLHFVKNDSGYLARVELISALYDEDGAYITESATSQSFFESFYTLTTSETENKTIQFNFDVAPGQYTLHLLFTDRVTDNMFEHKTEIDVRSLPTNEIVISDIEVASSIKIVDSDAVDVKNGKKVIAHPSRIFGDVYLKANFYFEIYNLVHHIPDRSSSFVLEYAIKDKKEETVQKFSKSYVSVSDKTALNFSVDVQKYKPGKYYLELEVIDEQSNKNAKARTNFNVVEPQKDLPLARYDRVLNVLNLFVKEKALKSKIEEKREKSVMALKLTKDNNSKLDDQDLQFQFHQRIAYANKAFPAMGKPGWKTDRGKIFIQYGKPDRVKKLKGNFGEKIEVWEYFQQELNFMFVDQQGYGDYLLIDNNTPN